MKCPKCGTDTRVYKTNTYEQVIERRRECMNLECQFRFSTQETQGSVKTKNGEPVEVICGI